MRIFRRQPAQSQEFEVRAEVVTPGLESAVEMTGTTTLGAHALATLFESFGLKDGGHVELAGSLMPDPTNRVDPQALAVYVEDRQIGFVPSYVASRLTDWVAPCQVQLWSAPTPEGLRVRGWVTTSTPPVWPHTESNPPAVTIEERRNERAASTRHMITEALAGEGKRAETFRRGIVGKLHYLETVEPIKQFKREGRLTEALALCYGAIQAAENDRDDGEPAPWYTEQAAIIHRKLGQRTEEEAVLRRWLALCPEDRRVESGIQQRLDKLTGSGS